MCHGGKIESSGRSGPTWANVIGCVVEYASHQYQTHRCLPHLQQFAASGRAPLTIWTHSTGLHLCHTHHLVLFCCVIGPIWCVCSFYCTTLARQVPCTLGTPFSLLIPKGFNTTGLVTLTFPPPHRVLVSVFTKKTFIPACLPFRLFP